MDPALDRAPALSVSLLRLGIGHCRDLALEAGLEATGEQLRRALEMLGGPLPPANGSLPS